MDNEDLSPECRHDVQWVCKLWHRFTIRFVKSLVQIKRSSTYFEDYLDGKPCHSVTRYESSLLVGSKWFPYPQLDSLINSAKRLVSEQLVQGHELPVDYEGFMAVDPASGLVALLFATRLLRPSAATRPATWFVVLCNPVMKQLKVLPPSPMGGEVCSGMTISVEQKLQEYKVYMTFLTGTYYTTNLMVFNSRTWRWKLNGSTLGIICNPFVENETCYGVKDGHWANHLVVYNPARGAFASIHLFFQLGWEPAWETLRLEAWTRDSILLVRRISSSLELLEMDLSTKELTEVGKVEDVALEDCFSIKTVKDKVYIGIHSQGKFSKVLEWCNGICKEICCHKEERSSQMSTINLYML